MLHTHHSKLLIATRFQPNPSWGRRTGAVAVAEPDALHFGLASACLKHSQPGDFSLADETEIAALVARQGFDVRR